MFLNRASNGCTNEQPNGYNAEALSKSCTNLISRVGAQVHEDCWRQTDKGTREKTVACHENDKASRRGDGYEAKAEDTSNDSTWYDYVEWSYLVGQLHVFY